MTLADAEVVVKEMGRLLIQCTDERDRYREALVDLQDLLIRRNKGGYDYSRFIAAVDKIAADALEPIAAVKDTARTVYGGPARSTGPNAPAAHS